MWEEPTEQPGEDRPRPDSSASAEEWKRYARYLERRKFRKNERRKINRLERENAELVDRLRQAGIHPV